jgi:hypothetical protein
LSAVEQERAVHITKKILSVVADKVTEAPKYVVSYLLFAVIGITLCAAAWTDSLGRNNGEPSRRRDFQ